MQNDSIFDEVYVKNMMQSLKCIAAFSLISQQKLIVPGKIQ